MSVVCRYQSGRYVVAADVAQCPPVDDTGAELVAIEPAEGSVPGTVQTVTADNPFPFTAVAIAALILYKYGRK